VFRGLSPWLGGLLVSSQSWSSVHICVHISSTHRTMRHVIPPQQGPFTLTLLFPQIHVPGSPFTAIQHPFTLTQLQTAAGVTSTDSKSSLITPLTLEPSESCSLRKEQCFLGCWSSEEWQVLSSSDSPAPWLS
jgi:hypothetical protein